jgi:uncharacterized repeat protein (TIGR02543 family)
VPGESVGTYAIQQGTLTAGSNYNLTYVDGTLSVTPETLTITADNQSKVYGTDDPLLTYQLNSGSLVNGDAFSGTLTRVHGENIGTYAIQQGTLTAGSNYNLTYVEGTLSVTPNLTVIIVGNGMVSRSNNGPYNIGEIIQLTTIPSSGWVFSGWNGDLIGNNNPMTIIMNKNMTVTATFVWGVGSGDVTLPAGTTDIKGMVTSEGCFTTALTVVSADKLCTLTIPKDIVGLDNNLKPLTQISITPMTTPLAVPTLSTVIGLPYDFGPEGTIFDPPVTISFSYDPTKIPNGINEQDLVLAFYDTITRQWVPLKDIMVDLMTHSISGKTSHFTEFGVIAYLGPATFTSNALTISPTEVKVGETVNIGTNITNTGDIAGSYDVRLKINNMEVETKKVNLAGHTSQKVTFTANRDIPGSYTITLDNLSGTFTVQEVQAQVPTPTEVLTPTQVSTPTEVPTPTQVSTPTKVLTPTRMTISAEVSTPTHINWGLITSLIAAMIIIIGMIACFLWRKRVIS